MSYDHLPTTNLIGLLTDKETAAKADAAAVRAMENNDQVHLAAIRAKLLRLLNEQGDVRTGPIAREDIGIYTDGVNTFKVQRARSGSHTFALRLVGSEFVFRNGDTKQLTRGAYRKLTRDEAAAYGHQFGRCIVCAADLTDPASVERGMGPVCAQRF